MAIWDRTLVLNFQNKIAIVYIAKNRLFSKKSIADIPETTLPVGTRLQWNGPLMVPAQK